MFAFSLQFFLKKFFFPRRTDRDMFKYVNWSSCRAPIIPVRL